jgi:hypothetical protein
MNTLQCTFILALYCQICMADDTNMVQLNHRVEQLERQVIHLVHLGTIFNQTILALQSEVDNLNTALENAQKCTGNIF